MTEAHGSHDEERYQCVECQEVFGSDPEDVIECAVCEEKLHMWCELDRITEVPASNQYHFVCFLCRAQAANTNVVSRVESTEEFLNPVTNYSYPSQVNSGAPDSGEVWPEEMFSGYLKDAEKDMNQYIGLIQVDVSNSPETSQEEFALRMKKETAKAALKEVSDEKCFSEERAIYKDSCSKILHSLHDFFEQAETEDLEFLSRPINKIWSIIDKASKRNNMSQALAFSFYHQVKIECGEELSEWFMTKQFSETQVAARIFSQMFLRVFFRMGAENATGLDTSKRPLTQHSPQPTSHPILHHIGGFVFRKLKQYIYAHKSSKTENLRKSCLSMENLLKYFIATTTEEQATLLATSWTASLSRGKLIILTDFAMNLMAKMEEICEEQLKMDNPTENILEIILTELNDSSFYDTLHQSGEEEVYIALLLKTIANTFVSLRKHAMAAWKNRTDVSNKDMHKGLRTTLKHYHHYQK